MATEAETLRRAVRRALAERAPSPAAERDRAHACALLDPADEGAARRAMTAHAALGETHRALGVYDRLWRTLDQRFGAEPGEETQALLARLRQGAAPDQRATPTADAAPTFWLPPCVADAAPGAQSTAAGLRLELAAAAARLPGWTVRLGDGACGVRARVGVGRAGEGFAFLLTLEEAETARVFWATRENATPAGAARAARGAHAAFARMTGAVAGSVGGGALALLAARSPAATPDLGNRDAPVSSASLLAGALDGAPPTLGMVEQALAEAHAAVDAEPLSAPSRRALGWAQLFARGFAQAAECFALAAELDPTDAEALREAALGLALCGEADAARTLLADAVALAPEEKDALFALAAVALGDPAPPATPGPLLIRAWCAPGACGALDAAGARRLARALPMADEARAAAIEAALLAAASHTA
jgi:tetratricopeptide (TPR) repeat protein